MAVHKKIYKLYRQTGALFVVLVVLTIAYISAIFPYGQNSHTLDISVASDVISKTQSGPAGYSAMPVVCTNGTWSVHFFWDLSKLGLPAGATPEQLSLDLKHNDNTDWGSNNFASLQLQPTSTNADWLGINPNEDDTWRINALYKGSWYGYQSVASLKTPECPGGNGMAVSYISCTADAQGGKFKMNFYWGNPQGLGGQPQQQYVDLKIDDGNQFWNPDGSTNFQSNGPLTANVRTIVWDGIAGGDQKHRWHVNTSYTDTNGQTQWGGYLNEGTFTTPFCPDAGGTWTGGGVGLNGGTTPGNGTYKLTAKLDKQSYNAGDTASLCYKLDPPDTQFDLTIKYSQNGTGSDYAVVKQLTDDGTGDCINISVGQNVATGPRKFQVSTTIKGQPYSAEVSTTFNAGSGTTPGVTNNPNPTGGVTPGVTNNPNPTTGTTPGVTNNPTIGVTIFPTGITPTVTSTIAPSPTGQAGDFYIKVDRGENGIYAVGDDIQACFKVPDGTPIDQFKITQTLPDGTDDLIGTPNVTSQCFPGTAGPATGRECINLHLLDGIHGNITRTTKMCYNIIASNTTTPTQTITPTGAAGTLALSVKLRGIGNAGTGENNNPTPNTRGGEIKVTDLASKVSAGSHVTFTYNKTTHTFDSVLTNVPQGIYQIKVRFDNSLWSALDPIQVTTSQPTATAVKTLNSGDLNGDNVLDLADYNIFLACYGAQSCSQKTQSDLNMDGKVDEVDLNIFYAGLSKRIGD